MDETKEKLMTIGSLAKNAGVGVETVRFYQRKGLLETPTTASGFRKYSQSDLRQIKFIKRVQELGFSLKDVQKLLEITSCSPETRPLLEQVCSEKVEQIQQKITDLNRMLEKLTQFHQSCAGDSSCASECNLLDCFENQWECCESRKEE